MRIGEVATFEGVNMAYDVIVTRKPDNCYVASINGRESVYYHVEALVSCMIHDGIIYRKAV